MRCLLLFFLLPLFTLGQRNEEEAFAKIREALEDPDAVTELDLSDYNINYLPPEIGLFTNLEKLWLQKNNLSSIPNSIGELKKLTHLSLEHNDLDELPEEFWQLSGLEKLWLSHNRLDFLDADLGNLVNLQWLICDGNPIYQIPGTVGKLSELEEFWLQSTELRSLPESITSLSGLKKLMLRGNPLEQMPVALHDLVSLEILDLRQTYLDYTSSEVSRLKWEMPNCVIRYDGVFTESDYPKLQSKAEPEYESIVFSGINSADLGGEENNNTNHEGQGVSVDGRKGKKYGFGDGGGGGTLLKKGTCPLRFRIKGLQTIAVVVCIDHKGKVTSVEFAYNGSTTTEQKFLEAAKCAVSDSEFMTKGMVEGDSACGTFTFVFSPGGVSF